MFRLKALIQETKLKGGLETRVIDAEPTLNVLLPSFSRFRFTGGPNTILGLTGRLAARGTPVRYVCLTDPPPDDLGYFWAHLVNLIGSVPRCVSVSHGTPGGEPVSVGPNDVWMATWWPSAYVAASRGKPFIYFIQDAEAEFIDDPVTRARAAATLNFDYRAIINQQVVADHLGISGAVFEPAVDHELFHPEPKLTRLVFYARPNRPRNLYAIGLKALKLAAERGMLDGWDVLSVGAKVNDIELTPTVTMTNIPWQPLGRYASMLRQTDVALSLQLSPHTSYPPLEMSACGGVAITNAYGAKTANRIMEYAPRSIVVNPTVLGVLDGIERAVAGERRDQPTRGCTHGSWNEAFAGVLPKVEDMFKELSRTPVASGGRM